MLLPFRLRFSGLLADTRFSPENEALQLKQTKEMESRNGERVKKRRSEEIERTCDRRATRSSTLGSNGTINDCHRLIYESIFFFLFVH